MTKKIIFSLIAIILVISTVFVISYLEMKNGELAYVELMPIELNFDKKEVWQKGNPRFSNQHGIIERLAKMSASFGTKIKIDDRDFGIVEI